MQSNWAGLSQKTEKSHTLKSSAPKAQAGKAKVAKKGAAKTVKTKFKAQKETSSALKQASAGASVRRTDLHTVQEVSYASDPQGRHRSYDNFRDDSKNMLQMVDKIIDDLKQKLREHGESHATFREALGNYQKHAVDTAQKMMLSGDLEAAQLVLRECEASVKNHPKAATAHMLYYINNNMASLANAKGNVRVSLRYLEAALDAGNDPKLTGQHALPLAETMLNMSNANGYLGNHPRALTQVEHAYGFAGKIAAQIEAQIKAAEREGESQEVVQHLKDAFITQINLLVLCRHSKGELLEKTKHYERAIREYKAGKKLVEVHLGTQHQFYSKLASAMGGAKLRAKTQSQHSQKSEHKRRKIDTILANASPNDTGTRRSSYASRSNSKSPKTSQLQKELRRSIASEQNPRARIQKEVQYQHRYAKKGDNVFLANAETWEKHGGDWKQTRRSSSKKSSASELKKIRLAAGRKRLTSTRKVQPQAYIETKKFAKRRPSIQSTQYQSVMTANAPVRQKRTIRRTRSSRSLPGANFFKKYKRISSPTRYENEQIVHQSKNGPGYHEWERPGAKTHFRVGNRGQSSAIHIGGGFQIAYKKPKKRNMICGSLSEGDMAPQEDCKKNFVSEKETCKTICSKSYVYNLENLCKQAETERAYMQQMSDLKNIQDEQFKMLTIMLEQEATAQVCCPMPPMTCQPNEMPEPQIYEVPEPVAPTPQKVVPKIEKAVDATPVMKEKPVQAKTETKEVKAQTTPPKERPPSPKPVKVVKVKEKTPSPVKSEGSCIELKRREVEREIDQLRRETCFKFIDLKNVLLEEENFEAEFSHEVVRHAGESLKHQFKLESEKICEPIIVDAIVRTKSEGRLEQWDHYSEGGSSYDSNYQYRFKIHQEGQVNLSKFWVRLGQIFEHSERRNLGYAFQQIQRAANKTTTVTRTVRVPIENDFILQKDYDFMIKRDVGKYLVKSFEHEYQGHLWSVTIFDIYEADGTSYYRIEATYTEDSNIFEYISLQKPLIVNIRYLIYYLRQTLEFRMKDGEVNHMTINTLAQENMQEFLVEMADLERKFGLPQIRGRSYSRKVFEQSEKSFRDDRSQGSIKSGHVSMTQSPTKRSVERQVIQRRESSHHTREQSRGTRENSLNQRSQKSEKVVTVVQDKSPLRRARSNVSQKSPVMSQEVSFHEQSQDPYLNINDNQSQGSVKVRRSANSRRSTNVRKFTDHIEPAGNRLIENNAAAPSSSSGNAASEPFRPQGEETANFMIERGSANEKTDFSIKMYIQDGVNKRYRIVVMNPNDNTDFKSLDCPYGTSIIREQCAEKDINDKLKIYVDSNGRIDYLALVDPSMNQHQVSPSRRSSQNGRSDRRLRSNATSKDRNYQTNMTHQTSLQSTQPVRVPATAASPTYSNNRSVVSSNRNRKYGSAIVREQVRVTQTTQNSPKRPYGTTVVSPDKRRSSMKKVVTQKTVVPAQTRFIEQRHANVTSGVSQSRSPVRQSSVGRSQNVSRHASVSRSPTRVVSESVSKSPIRARFDSTKSRDPTYEIAANITEDVPMRQEDLIPSPMRQHSAISRTNDSGYAGKRRNVMQRVVAGNDGLVRTQEMWEDDQGNSYTRTFPVDQYQRGERFSIHNKHYAHLRDQYGIDDREVEIENGQVVITRSPSKIPPKVNHQVKFTNFNHAEETDKLYDAIEASKMNGMVFQPDQTHDSSPGRRDSFVHRVDVRERLGMAIDDRMNQETKGSHADFSLNIRNVPSSVPNQHNYNSNIRLDKSQKQTDIYSELKARTNNSIERKSVRFGDGISEGRRVNTIESRRSSVARKGRQSKKIAGILEKGKLHIKYMVTSDVDHKHWQIAIKDMNTQKFICENMPFPFQAIAQGNYEQQKTVIRQKMEMWLDRNEHQLAHVRSISAGTGGYFEI